MHPHVRQRLRRFRPVLIWLVAALPTVGCSSESERIAVSGEVSMDGAPVPNGEITFAPADGSIQQATAPIVEGQYAMDERFGAVPGSYRVMIRGFREIPATGPGNPYAPDAVPTEQYIPARYNERTTLTAEVSADQPRHDFQLQSSAN